jgi:hypothetical protein
MWLTTAAGRVVTAVGFVGFRVTLTLCLSQYQLRDCSDHKRIQFVARHRLSDALSVAELPGESRSIIDAIQSKSFYRGSDWSRDV